VEGVNEGKRVGCGDNKERKKPEKSVGKRDLQSRYQHHHHSTTRSMMYYLLYVTMEDTTPTLQRPFFLSFP
jgi:hypothetical protein